MNAWKPLALAALLVSGCGSMVDGEEERPTVLGRFLVTDLTSIGRLRVESPQLLLEFGYESRTCETGGNIVVYVDKRFGTPNIAAVWDGCTNGSGAYAIGGAHLGATSMYGASSLNRIEPGSYSSSMSDNGRDSERLGGPALHLRPDEGLDVSFLYRISNSWLQEGPWYEIEKIWTIWPSGRVRLEHRWHIVLDGYFSEPASRSQVPPLWQMVSRWGHRWEEPPAGSPGTNSRINPRNRWWHWQPMPGSRGECNANNGLDAVHADYVRLWGGQPFDFWFWPDNDGLGFEGLGSYRLGYYQGPTHGSFGNSVFEICNHDRRAIGDGSAAYSLTVAAWWGGDGAERRRFVRLSAGTRWTDSYQMEVRPPGDVFPDP